MVVVYWFGGYWVFVIDVGELVWWVGVDSLMFDLVSVGGFLVGSGFFGVGVVEF